MFHRFSVGALRCTVLFDGKFTVAAGFVARNVHDEELASVGLTPETRVDLSVTAVLIERDDQHILIDAGLGTQDAPKGGQVVNALAAAGVQPGNIDLVVITHGHGDHIGGLLDDGGELLYHNARYIMSQAEWDFWLGDTPFDDPATSIAGRVFPLIADKTTFVTEEQMIAPGVTVLFAFGHTGGHTIIMLADGGDRRLYLADMVVSPLHLAHPHWLARPDADPERVVAQRHHWLGSAADNRTPLLLCHAPWPALGTVARNGDAYAWQPD